MNASASSSDHLNRPICLLVVPGSQRGYSAMALGNIGMGTEAVVDALTHGLTDEEDDVRILVARALGSIGPDAISAVPKLKAVLVEEALEDELQYSVERSLSEILRKSAP